MRNSSNALFSLIFIFQISTFAIEDLDAPDPQDEAIAIDGTSDEEPVSGSINTNYTGSDYNLGRIIGTGPLFNVLTSYWPRDAFMFLDMYHAQGGIDNTYNIGWSAVGTVSGEKDYDPYWMLSFRNSVSMLPWVMQTA